MTLKKMMCGSVLVLCCNSTYAELNTELKQNIGNNCQEKSSLAAEIMTERQNGKEFVDMVKTAADLQKNAQTPEQRGLAQFYAALALRVSRQPIEEKSSAKASQIEQLRKMVLSSCQQKQI